MDNKKLDELFDEAFDEAVRSELKMEVPDPSASWERMSVKLQKHVRRRRLRKRLQTAALAVAALLLAVAVFSPAKETEAFLPVTKIWDGVKDGVVTLFQGDKKELEKEPSKKMLTAPPPGNVGPIMGQGTTDEFEIAATVQVKTLDEAKAATVSRVPVPTYVPAGYQLFQAELRTNAAKRLVNGVMLYQESGSGAALALTVTPVAMNKYSNLQVDPDDKLEHLQISGTEAAYIRKGADTGFLNWMDSNYAYQLIGKVSKEEMVRFAEGMK
ncbi:DUF4367 domain-containing protein [Gorillibacterium sp. sgz5001074]|uniref:DUF4367 domain-containing protein n=1 Tax=Gorillibacterium sp. sgz5001074 TaxID=3446695 RepID=UPI003F66838E